MDLTTSSPASPPSSPITSQPSSSPPSPRPTNTLPIPSTATSFISPTPTPTPFNTHCPTCSSPARLPCPSCKSVRYCSIPCGLLDHPIHKTICKKAALPAYNPLTHRLALFFPPSSPDPVLTPVRLSSTLDGSDDIHHSSLAALWDVPTTKHTRFATMQVSQNVRKLRVLEGEIAVLFTDPDGEGGDSDEDTIMDEDARALGENACVAGLVEGRYVMAPKWKGPVLVVGVHPRKASGASSETGGEEGVYKLRDLRVADLTDVVDILGTHGPKSQRKEETLCVDVRGLPAGTRVQCQFVRCTRETRRRNNARTSTLCLSSSQLAAIEEKSPGECLTLSRMIGLPMKMYPLASAAKKARPKQHLCHDREHICDMFKSVGVLRWHGMNPSRMNMGFHNKDCPGEVLLVREDGKPLTAMQVNAIWSFAKEVGEGLMDAFETCDTLDEETKMGNSALLLANEAGYREWFEMRRAKEISKHNLEWKDAKPY